MPEPSMGLAEAIANVIDISEAGLPAAAPDDQERMIAIIAENDGLPKGEIERIENAIGAAYRGWPDAQRRAIWYETARGGEERPLRRRKAFRSRSPREAR